MQVAERSNNLHSTHLMLRFTRVAVFSMLVGVVPAYTTSAQATDSLLPRSGTWAAEASVISGGGSLLYFTSPRGAWLVGLSAGINHSNRPATLGLPDNSASSTNFQAQLGHRWYSGAAGDGEHLRATYGAGLIGAFARTTFADQSDRTWSAGGYGEIGATWFFTRHLSLGAIGQLTATRGYTRQIIDAQVVGGGVVALQTLNSTTWGINANLVRVLAGVYF
jgi:hypothetical protein